MVVEICGVRVRGVSLISREKPNMPPPLRPENKKDNKNQIYNDEKKTSELIFKRMFLTSKRRRERGDRPHTTVEHCREVSPRGIYERQYKFAAAANPINYCLKVLALPPLLVLYIIYI